MHRVWMLALVTVLCGCESKVSPEVHAVSSCDARLKQSLIAPNDLELAKTWKYERVSGVDPVSRHYAASDSKGKRDDAIYYCSYDPSQNLVTSLEITDSLGRQQIVTAISQPVIDEGPTTADIGSASESSVAPDDRKWIVKIAVTGCPAASDWFEMQDAVAAGDFSVNLPSRCFRISPGTIVLAPPEGSRQAVTRKGHSFERGRLESGLEFWTDEMDKLSLEEL